MDDSGIKITSTRSLADKGVSSNKVLAKEGAPVNSFTEAYEFNFASKQPSDALPSAMFSNVIISPVTVAQATPGLIFSSAVSTQALQRVKNVCKICHKPFPWPKDLEIHMRIHTGEKPYSCHMCSYKSAQKGNLKRHMYTVHNITTQ